jgi:hypothetical protein
MKKERKAIYLDERNKRLLIYISLLAAAVFIAIQDPHGIWLSIGLSVGILYGLASDWIFNRKKKKQSSEQLPESPAKIEESAENKNDKT